VGEAGGERAGAAPLLLPLLLLLLLLPLPLPLPLTQHQHRTQPWALLHWRRWPRHENRQLTPAVPAANAPQLAAGAPSALPALQELRGSWSGGVQAYGGAGGSTALDFNLKGSSWQWGEWTLDQVGAA
jgi:hypothetical protein